MPKSRLSGSGSLKLVQRRCGLELSAHAHTRAHGMRLAGLGAGAGTTALLAPGRSETADRHGLKEGLVRSYLDEAASFYRPFKRIFHNYTKCKSRKPGEVEFSPDKSVHRVLCRLSSMWVTPCKESRLWRPEGGVFTTALRGGRSSLCRSRGILWSLGRSKPLGCGVQASPGWRPRPSAGAPLCALLTPRMEP